MLSREDKILKIQLLEEKLRRAKGRKILTYYPDQGPLRRELYPKHMSFFEAGTKFRERLMMAANRVGKTEAVGGYETALHLTGNYPSWWIGKRFDKSIKAWAAGDTGKTVREIVQEKLLGPLHDKGTGLIERDSIIRVTNKQGISDAVDTIFVKHKSGGMSQLTLKSYDQRRVSFQGSEQDLIWLDEEPPLDIYTECLMRTMTNNGIIMLTFTPLMGMSDTVLSFLSNGEVKENNGSKFVVTATWDDAAHLSDEVKKSLWESIPPFQRDARSKGIPQLGAGAIYPVVENDILVNDFEIPDHWPKFYGMDVGWNRTAAAFMAHDRQNDIIYLYSEYYRGQAEPSIHADGIKSRGQWIKGVIDPAANGRSQHDGLQLIESYKSFGLDVEPADNSVEAGIYKVWQLLSTGKLKVFKSCQNWLSEYRLYRRDENGKIVKQNDHIMDATRYAIMSGFERASLKPVKKEEVFRVIRPTGWMG